MIRTVSYLQCKLLKETKLSSSVSLCISAHEIFPTLQCSLYLSVVPVQVEFAAQLQVLRTLSMCL